MSVTNQLEIDIKAKSDKATTSLDGLIAKLNEVNSALNGLNVERITQISNSVKGLKGVHIKTSGSGGSGGGGNGGSGSNSTNATNNGLNRTTALMKLFTKSSDGANRSILNFRGSMLKLAATWGTFYAAMYPALRLFGAISKQIENSMDYTETFNYFKVTMGKIGHDSGEEFADQFYEQIKNLNEKMTGFSLGKNGELLNSGAKSLGLDPTALMNFEAQVGSITNSVGLLGKTSTATQKALSMLASDYSSLRNIDLDKSMQKFASGLIGQSRSLYSLGIDITNTTLKEYALAHGVTKSVSAMSQAEKMQLRLLAILGQSKVAWGDQANTISSVANQYRILKQQVSNLGRVIGNMFLPIVKTVLPYLNAFVMVLQRVFDILGHKVYGKNWLSDISDGISAGNFSDLNEDIEDTEDAINGATKAAKKFKQATMGFDELNIISPETSSGSGSGSSGGGAGFDLSGDIQDALDEYQSVWDKAFANMTNKAEDIANKIISYVDAKNWFGLGKWMGTSITNQLSSIPWTTVYSGARNFGQGLADFLNGLISPELFYQVGKTIADSLNTALYFTLNFAKTFDFSNFGESIGNGINGFFENYDFKALATTLNTWVDGIETTIGKAFETISWKDVFKGLYTFFSNLEIDTVTLIFAATALKGVKFEKGFFKHLLIEAAKEIAKNIAKSPIPQLALTFTKMVIEFNPDAVVWALSDLVTEIDETLTRLFPKLTESIGHLLSGAVSGAISGSVIPGIGTLIGALGGSLVQAINDLDPNIFSWEWTDKWFKKMKKDFKTAFDGNRESIAQIGAYILEGILDGFAGAITFITEPIARFFIEFVKGIKDIFGIHSPAKEMYPLGNFIFLGIVEGFKEKFGEWTTAIETWYTNDVKPWFTKEKWLTLGQGIKDGLSDKWSSFSKWWKDTGFKNWWDNDVSPWFTKEPWGGFGQNVKDGLSGKWSEFTDWWKSTGFYNWWNTDVTPWFDKKKWTFDGIKEGLSEAWRKAITAIKALWNGFADFLNDSMNIHIDALVDPITGNEIWGARDIQLARIPKFNIPQYAIGGFPEDGLFYANHNEMVGQFTNGQTAVANNEQIVEGIKSGVASAVQQVLAPYLREIAENTGSTATNTDAIAKKPVQTLTDRSIAKANIRGQRSLGLQLRTT